MKKIIWIYGDHATGKTLLLKQLSEVLGFELLDAYASAAIEQNLLSKKVVLIDNYIDNTKLEKDLKHFSEDTQIIVCSQYPPSRYLKENIILLKAENACVYYRLFS